MTFTDDINPPSRPPLPPAPNELAAMAIQRVDQAIEIMIDTMTGNLYEEYGDDTITEKTCRDAILNALWFRGMDTP